MKGFSLAAVAAIALVAFAVGGAAANTWDPALDTPVLINNGNTFILSAPVSFDVQIDPSERLVTGFSFIGDVFMNPLGFAANAMWTQMTITAPNGFSYIVGGVSGYDSPWDFGSQGESGTYGHGIGGEQWFGDGLPDFAFDEIPIGGTWNLHFRQMQSTANPANWSNVTVTLHSIPEPGTILMLLALGVFMRRPR